MNVNNELLLGEDVIVGPVAYSLFNTPKQIINDTRSIFKAGLERRRKRAEEEVLVGGGADVRQKLIKTSEYSIEKSTIQINGGIFSPDVSSVLDKETSDDDLEVAKINDNHNPGGII